MSAAPSHNGLPPPQACVDRDLRAMVGDGAAFSVMVGLGESLFAAFALAGGLGDAVAGWMTTLPMLAGGLLQLVTPFMVARLASCRRWVVLCAGLQAASLVPLVAAGWLGVVPAALLFACATLYWAAGMATGPAWNVWAETLVPTERRTRFFANRGRWCQLALVAALLGGGLALQFNGSLQTFALLFAVAAAARALSTGCLASQSERPGLASSLRPQNPWRAWRGLRGSDGERVLLYLLGMQTAANISGPFFTPYMLGPVKLDYLQYTVLSALPFAARIAVLPALGRLAHARSHRAVLWFGALSIIPLPSMWLVSHDFRYLIGLQIVAGTCWAAMELATLLAFFDELAASERASVLSAYNLASAFAIATGSLLGGALLSALGATPMAYGALFLCSSTGRVLSLLLLRRLAPAGLELRWFRALGLRPSLAAVPRPILATLPETSPAPGAAAPTHVER